MKVIWFVSARYWKMADGWRPSWSKYIQWLASRKHARTKQRNNNIVVAERKKKNDEVIRSYGLKSNKPKPRS